jgi:hypothetical protein
MNYGAEMISCYMIEVLRFVKTDAGIQAILRFSHRNLRGCNFCTTYGENL